MAGDGCFRKGYPSVLKDPRAPMLVVSVLLCTPCSPSRSHHISHPSQGRRRGTSAHPTSDLTLDRLELFEKEIRVHTRFQGYTLWPTPPMGCGRNAYMPNIERDHPQSMHRVPPAKARGRRPWPGKTCYNILISLTYSSKKDYQLVRSPYLRL